MNKEVLLESVIFVFSEPLLVIVGPLDWGISVVGFVALTWVVRSVLAAVVLVLDRAMDTFNESRDLEPFDWIVVLMPVLTRES